jgi:RNase P/RNase MRP subunit p30
MGKISINLIKASRRFAKGIIPLEMEVDKRVIESIKENDSMLLIPLNHILTTYGMVRVRNIKMTSRTLEYALKRRINIGFITLASSEGQLVSYMQLIELAKLIGAPENIARSGISEINKHISEAIQ